MGRHRFGAALTLAVLLLYGWVPAGLVSLTVVVLVGIARRHRWRQGVLHGAVDILGIAAGALVLALFGGVPPVERPWRPDSWTVYAPRPRWCWSPSPTSLVTRLLLWYLLAPQGRGLPTVARTALLRQGLVAVALLGIAPLICRRRRRPARSCCRSSPSRSSPSTPRCGSPAPAPRNSCATR